MLNRISLLNGKASHDVYIKRNVDVMVYKIFGLICKAIIDKKLTSSNPFRVPASQADIQTTTLASARSTRLGIIRISDQQRDRSSQTARRPATTTPSLTNNKHNTASTDGSKRNLETEHDKRLFPPSAKFPFIIFISLVHHQLSS